MASRGERHPAASTRLWVLLSFLPRRSDRLPQVAPTPPHCPLLLRSLKAIWSPGFTRHAPSSLLPLTCPCLPQMLFHSRSQSIPEMVGGPAGGWISPQQGQGQVRGREGPPPPSGWDRAETRLENLQAQRTHALSSVDTLNHELTPLGAEGATGGAAPGAGPAQRPGRGEASEEELERRTCGEGTCPLAGQPQAKPSTSLGLRCCI